MPAVRRIRVEVHELERHLWCPHCRLPSAVRWAVVDRDNPMRWFDRLTVCQDCGERL